MGRELKNKEIERLIKFECENTYKCKCGHSLVIYPKENKKLCRWCGKYVYKSKQDEFKDKLINVIRKENSNE